MKSAECPVCGFNEPELYLSKSFENLKSIWLRCEKCKTLFMSPLPTEQKLAEYYLRGYKKRNSPGTVSHCFRCSEENKKILDYDGCFKKGVTKPGSLGNYLAGYDIAGFA